MDKSVFHVEVGNVVHVISMIYACIIIIIIILLLFL